MLRRILPFLKYAFAIGVIAYFGYYVFDNWPSFYDSFSRLDYATVAAAILLTLVQWIVRTLRDKMFFRRLGRPVEFWTLFTLQNMQVLLNHLPARVGTVYAAHRLRSRHDVPYTELAAVFAGQTLIIIAAVCLSALLAMFWLPEAFVAESWIMVAGVAGIGGAALGALVMSAFPRLWGWLPGARIVEKVRHGLHTIMGNSPLRLAIATGLSLFSFLLGTARLAIAFHAIGHPISYAAQIVLGAISHIGLYVSITPSAIGVREGLLGGASSALGASVQVGVLAATVERALIFVALIGIVAVSWLVDRLFRRP